MSSVVPASDPKLERKLRLVGGAGDRLFASLFATCRWETAGEENYLPYWNAGKAVVFNLWHGRLLPCTFRHRGHGVATLISQHRDGEYIARIVERWGFHVVRGSSSRGGTEALRGLMRAARQGKSLAITPDGPRGPREKMKPGPLIIAQRLGIPIIPVLGSASRAWYFGGWDRFLVPKPFSTVRVLYEKPMWVPPEADEAGLEAFGLELEAKMAEVKARVDDFSRPLHA
jgi:lysophospholipid acyltransferase (LPLAT)-like uncharacterized protein